MTTTTHVETAVPLSRENDLEEPLIQRSDEADVVMDVEDLVMDDETVSGVFYYFLILGWSLGFLLQCVSLGATAVSAFVCKDGRYDSETISLASRTLYWTLFGLSNSWLLLFPVICLAIERSWTDSGVKYIQTNLLSMQDPVINAQSRRVAFVASVRFLIGVVLGCFMTWALIDFHLGASYSMLLTLLVSMISCLTLCQGMVFIYDMFSS